MPQRQVSAARSRPLAAAAGATPKTPKRAQRSPVRGDSFGTLRVALVAQIPPLLEELGSNSAQVLQRAGIPSRSLAGAENRIGYQAVGRLLGECVRATGLAHFGILAGEHFVPAAALGEVIEVMQNSPTVEAALQVLLLHHHLNDSGAVPMLLPGNGRRVALAHSILWHDVPALETFYDAAMAYGMQIMRSLCGGHWQPFQVTLTRSTPIDLTPYTRMFGRRIRFGASLSALEFPSDLLKRRVIGANPARYAVVSDELRQRLHCDSAPLAEQVRRALRPMILAGTASASNVASLFSISERVLRNRLALEGETARRLIQQARLEMASQLLRTTQLTISEIGAAAGYADPPSFVRAFKSQYLGATPGEWRLEVARGAR